MVDPELAELREEVRQLRAEVSALQQDAGPDFPNDPDFNAKAMAATSQEEVLALIEERNWAVSADA